ncbi:oxidoreductase [soil metagenome]
MSDYNADALPDLTNQTVIVTGGSSGIGQAAVAALASTGAHVVVAVRNTAKGETAIAGMPGSIEVRKLDLADLASVRSFAENWSGPVNVLINNAGVSALSLQRTRDGFEMDFGTNHLGHFALTCLLLPHVKDRIVTVASQAERAARLDLNDPNWEARPFRPSRAYNDSKLANLLFTAELDRRLRADGSTVRAVAAHPGLVITSIYDKPAGSPRSVWDRIVPALGQDPAQGALPLLFAATQDIPGNAFIGPQHLLHMRGGAESISRSATAKDPALAQRLWALSEVLVGLPQQT